ncbi:hypothetical protein ACE6H2_015595 [Prunus campanulata]
MVEQIAFEEKWARLNRLLGNELVGGSFTCNIFGGGRHSIVLESPSLSWCQVYSFLWPQTR